MKGHLITVFVLLSALACYVTGLTGAGLVLFFIGAALGIALWLSAVQSPRRLSSRLPARLHARR